jgi:integrase
MASKVTVGLTDAKLQGLRPPASGQVEYPDSAVPGLRVRIGVGGTKSFILRKRVAGKWRNVTLGRYSERFTLAAARKKARTLLSDIEFKADPVAALPKPRPYQSAGFTVRALWPDYKAAKSHLRNLREVERVFHRHILPEFGDRAADSVTRAEITRFIDEIARTAPGMARRTLSYLSSFYGWALPRLDRLPGNPCRDAGRPRRPKSRERVLGQQETGLLWNILEGEREPFGSAIQLLLLTGQRRNEVFNADCSEFDLQSRVWTIPGARAKNGVAHLVPLPLQAISIVKELTKARSVGKLFPARGNAEAGPSGFSKAMTRIRAALEEQVDAPVPHWTLHDLRRTLATGMQRLGVRLEVTEAVLNHLSGSRSGIVGVYQRHNYFIEKRAALNAWAKEVRRLARTHKLHMGAASERSGSGSSDVSARAAPSFDGWSDVAVERVGATR